MDVSHELQQLLAGMASHFPPDTRLVSDLPPLPPVTCRVPLMLQAFTNILDNAIKSRDSGLLLTVRAASTGNTLVITIADNGCGIPPEQLARVFEPFFTTRPVGSGSGMGLAVAHQAVSSIGGSIEIRSEPGQGTTCSILLPRPPEAV